MESLITIQVLGILLWITSMILGPLMATQRRNRRPYVWFSICAWCGLIGFFILCIMKPIPTRRRPEETVATEFFAIFSLIGSCALQFYPFYSLLF